MKNSVSCSAETRALGLILLAVFAAGSASAEGNINATNKFAWAENAGWVNFSPTNGGVTVVRNGANGYLSGYAWAENIGWVKLGADGGGPYLNTDTNNYGVNMDAGGNLSGYAWSENCGWINFYPTHSQVTISTSGGSFDGYAWAENAGWVHFKNASPAYSVLTTAFNSLIRAINGVLLERIKSVNGVPIERIKSVNCSEL